MAPYLHLVRVTFLRLMAYRMRYVTGIATYSIFVGVHYFLWKAVFAARQTEGLETVGGMELSALATYLAVGYMARSAYFTNTDGEIAGRFQGGEVVMDLLRPIDFHLQWLAQALGETLFRICFFSLPMAIVIVPLFGVLPPADHGWWAFPLLFLLAFWVNTELNILTGTAAFWLEDITGLMSFKRNLVMLGSGLMVPLHFLRDLVGDALTTVLLVSPLAAIGAYPTLAWTGHLGQDLNPGLAMAVWLAAAWGLALRMMNLALWAAARRRLEVQGG